MIKQKLKQCKGPCGDMKKLFSHGLCIDCFRKLNPPKIKSNPIQNKKQNWIKQCSDKHIERTKKYQKIRENLLEEFPICKVCNINPSTEVHHAKGRGKYLFEYLIPICRACHNWCHQNVKEAEEKGFIISRIKK